MTTTNDLCDVLRSILEPDPTLCDDACARPTQFQPRTLYVWPARETHAWMGTRDLDAAIDEVDLTIRVAWAADRAGEGDTRDRDVSDEIAERLSALATALRAAPTRAGVWDDARMEGVDHEGILGPDVRGFIATIRCRSHRSLT